MPIFEHDATEPERHSPDRRGASYARLSAQLRQAGLLDRRVPYYAGQIVGVLAALAACWTAFALVGDSWWQLGVAVVMAVVFTQAGFLVHDAGHRQIFASRRANDRIGVLFANLAIGLSYRWWVREHNRHHAHPNQEGKDPGIDVGVLAFTTAQAADRGRLARFAYRYQAYFFFPLLLFTALGLHAESARDLSRAKGGAWERALFAVHVAGYVLALLWVLSPAKAVAFLVVHQGLFGLYVGGTVAPNHKGMATLGADDHADFVWRQVVTSRNIRSNRFVDFVFGGLNHQIEHHLFPRMARPNLPRSRSVVRRFCEEHGLAYTETGVLDSYARTLRHLHTVGRLHRMAEPPPRQVST
ncbi:fatty acid desaturase family protein [Streptosporangium sp. G11]|uniref:fatty acid desaturase family protein n=1 Tax=Streptosporangium sp. G11 TaxID=3436926 RepID=UPI003EBA9BC1